MKTSTIYIILFILIIVLSMLLYIWYTGSPVGLTAGTLKPILSDLYMENIGTSRAKRAKSRGNKTVKFSNTVLERKIDEEGGITDRPIEIHASVR